MREARVTTWIDGLGGDLRQGRRLFRRHPMLTALALLTLSLGIGANAAIFSVFQAVLLRQLPYPDADRLMLLLDGRRDEGGVTTPTIPELLDVRAASRSFDAIAFFDTRDFQVEGGEEPQRVAGARVEPSLLPMLGARPALGRLLTEDDRAGNGAVVVLADGFWRRNFGANPAVVGQRLAVNGESFEIVGVLPAAFSSGFLSVAPIDLYVPYPGTPDYMSRSGAYANVRRVTALARLGAGVTHAQASAELQTVAAAIAAQYPDLYAAGGARPSAFVMTAQPLQDALTRGTRPVLFLLVGAVVLLLLIACVNTAQFLLAQAIDREPEVALRSALGATRGRLVRQFVTEAFCLTAIGGLVGAAQAVWLTRALRGLVPAGTPVVGDIGLDASVLLFLAGVTILMAAACALVPALRFSQPDLIGRMATRGAGRARGRLRLAFIAGEIAMSVVLLVGAALLLESIQALQRAQGGFSTERVTVLRLRGMVAGSALGDTYSRYLAEISRVGGIEAAAAASSPMPGRPANPFSIVGRPADAGGSTRQQASYQIVSPGYFATLGIPLEAGRLFTEDDRAGGPPVAVVNREMAERFWPGGHDALGAEIRAGDGPRAATMRIVGIVGNVRPPFQTGDVPQLYVSYRQQSEPNITLLVRIAPGSPLPLSAIKQAIWSIESKQAVFGVSTLDAQLARATASQRALTTLLGGFAALAVIMSIAGIYTVIAYVVSRRSREIAVRRAIGATGRDVLWSLADSTLRWTVAGLIAGAGAAVAGAQVIRGAVTGVVPLDATLMSVVISAYLVIVLAAIGAAARSALSIDPASALRAE